MFRLGEYSCRLQVVAVLLLLSSGYCVANAVPCVQSSVN